MSSTNAKVLAGASLFRHASVQRWGLCLVGYQLKFDWMNLQTWGWVTPY